MRTVYLTAMICTMFVVSADADTPFRETHLKFMGRAHFPVSNEENPRGIILAYLLPDSIKLDNTDQEESEYLRRAFYWACNARHYRIYFDTKGKYTFTRIHIFLAHQPPKNQISDGSTSKTLDANTFKVETENLEYFEKSFGVLDGKCGISIDPKTYNDLLKKTFARYLYGDPK